MVNKKREKSLDSSDSSYTSTPVVPVRNDQQWVNNALRGGGNEYRILKNQPAAELHVDHFFGTGDVAKIILKGKELQNITVKELKKVSDYLNNKNNCFKIDANRDIRKGKVNLETYFMDSMVTEYLNDETSNGKTVRHYITKNVERMMNDDNDLAKFVGNYLNERVISKI